MNDVKEFVTRRLWPFLVGAGSASIMILAFFVPSIQDQWDRYQARKVIEQYVQLGDDFVNEEKYEMAIQAFSKAYELSEEKRLDIEVKRLKAKIRLIDQDPAWGSKGPDILQEVDFEFLLHLQKGTQEEKHRATTLNSYGIYLASEGRSREAEAAFQEAIRLDTSDVLAYINLGNLYDQKGEKKDAEKSYRKAISSDPMNVLAHYNLGLLLSDEEKLNEAANELGIATKLDPADSDAIREHRLILKKMAR